MNIFSTHSKDTFQTCESYYFLDSIAKILGV